MKNMSTTSRRAFIASTAASALGVSVLPSILGQSPAGGKAKNVIFLYMGGGMSHLDTFDPKPGAETQGKTGIAKTPVAGINLGEFLPKLAAGFNDIALVRSMGQLTGDHRGGSYWMHTSYAPKATIIHPTMGPWAQRLLGKRETSLPDSVLVGGGGGPGAGFFGPSMDPLPIGNPMKGIQNSTAVVPDEEFDKRVDMLSTFNQAFTNKFKTDDVKAYTDFYRETLKLMKSSDLEAFDLTKEADYAAKLDRYGDNRIGQGLLLAKRLVKSGVRFIEIEYGGWDMHNNLWDAMPVKAGELDNALSSLIADLKAEGLLDETLICLASEFGRTPIINANGGRDHHPRCFTTLFAGGGIVGGQVYGASDEKGIAVKENPTTPKDFNATIGYALGLPLDKLVYSPSGRPFLLAGHRLDPTTKEIVSEGQPIKELFV